jgi:phospholipid/cholesterol/gamma-HCH transport system substrate-binding protein
METRARYALIGLFMLAVIAASFAFVYWLENKGGFAQRETYQVRFQGSVSGLLIGSAVLFNGIHVGEVTGLSLSADRPQDVVATIAVARGTPIRDDTEVVIETQGLTGGAAVALKGGTSSELLPTSEGGAPPTLIAAPQAGQDWTQSARDAFQRVDSVLAENSEALHSAITNIDTFADALARNSDKVDSILAGLEKMTGGGTSQAEIPVYDLVAASTLPPKPEEEPSWLLVVPEPTTLMGFNTDKILLQPAQGESVPLANARWSDNLPVLVQEKVIQSFEKAGYERSISRTREGVTGDYQLLIDIRRFHITTGSEPQAEIEFVAKILDKDGKIINASTFQATAPAKGNDAQAYVDAVDEAFGKLQSELLEWTTGALELVPPAPVTAEPAPEQSPPVTAEPAPEPSPPVTVEPPAPDQPGPADPLL